MITINCRDNNTPKINVKAALSFEHFSILCSALQAQVSELVTEPGNAPEKLTALKELADQFGVELDMQADTALATVEQMHG